MTMVAPLKPPGKKHRDCPVLGRVITPAECGSQRGSVLNCPATCPHFPFGVAAPELWLRLESEWSVKALTFLQAQLGRETLQTLIKQTPIPAPNPPAQLNATLHYILMTELFLKPVASGATRGEAWLESAGAGLNNDERVMTRHRRHARATVIEVERVLPDGTFSCRDLFDPERPPFVLCDRGMNRQAVRFTRLLGWLTHYPGASRLTLPAFEVGHHLWDDWERQVKNGFASEGQPGTSLRDFLSFHFARYAGLLHTLGEAYMDRLLSQMDMHRCVASFKLKVPASEIEAVLRGKPEFQEEPAPAGPAGEAPEILFNWLRQGDSAALDKELEGLVIMDSSVGGVGTAGRLRLGGERLVLETLSKTKYGFTRRKLVEYLGDKVEFVEESIEDLTRASQNQRQQDATVTAAERVFYDPGDVGPEIAAENPAPASSSPLEEEARKQALREAHERTYAGFVDKPLQPLEGKTPRVAAQDPGLRPRLVDIMKSHVQGIERRNVSEGLDLNLDAILDTLGLVELK